MIYYFIFQWLIWNKNHCIDIKYWFFIESLEGLTLLRRTQISIGRFFFLQAIDDSIKTYQKQWFKSIFLFGPKWQTFCLLFFLSPVSLTNRHSSWLIKNVVSANFPLLNLKFDWKNIALANKEILIWLWNGCLCL
jgi:hypothetical protein